MRNIVAGGLLVCLLSCGSGGADRDAKVTAEPAKQVEAAVPQQAQEKEAGTYRAEFIDSLKRNFHVEACCASPVAQCAETKPECGIAPRLNTFINWMGGVWKNDPKVNEQQMIGWLQEYHTSLTGEKKYFPETKGWPVLGDPNAPVTVILYYSAFCPASKSSIRDMGKAVTTGPLKGKAKIVAKALNAIPGDKALMAAHDMGRFSDLLRILSWAGQINEQTVSDYADALRFDKAKFNAAMESESVKKRLDQSSAEAREYNITRIPTYIVSGRRYTSMTSPQWLSSAIELSYETEVKK